MNSNLCDCQVKHKIRSPAHFDSAVFQRLSQMTNFKPHVLNREITNLNPFPTRFRWPASDSLTSFLLPTVLAQELVTSPDFQRTTVDRLESARPQIIISEKEVKDYIDSESGLQRVKEMFTNQGDGENSEDLDLILQTTRNCGLLVFLFASVFGGNAAREKFLEKSKHKVYPTKFQALRAYNDALVFGSLRFGLKWALKSAFFAALFMTTAQTISIYRNRSSVLEYTVAGGVTCALWRMSVGLRGMFAGAVIGGTMGLISGGCICALMYMTNSTQQQRRFWTIERMLREKRETDRLKPEFVESQNSG